MSKRILPGLMLAVLLISMLTLTFNIQPGEASGTIYIRADGSIDPPTAPIHRNGDVYTLTDNIAADGYYGIVVERDNIVVDGAGFTVQGTWAYCDHGIYLWGRSNVTVKNTRITGFLHGITLYGSSNNVLTGNTIINISWAGIVLGYSSNNNTLTGNTMTNSGNGTWLGDSSNCNSIFGNNMTNNKCGIGFLGSSNNNVIYHNNFINNARQVHDYSLDYPDFPPSINVWDDGYPSGGNYWSDYNGTDINEDSIGDTPYVIDANNQDNYPLMGPWTVGGQNVTVTPSNDVTITFGNVTSEGITTLNVSSTGPEPPSGFKLTTETPTYYDIKTTANYTGPIQLSVTYNDTGLTQDQENNLRLMHWNETLQQWIDITTSIDTENDIIYGETSHLSIFGVMLSPNIATTSTTVSKTVIGQGYSITINVTVENHGGYTETFNATVQANTTIIQTKTITLTSGNSSTVTFAWNTTDFAKGNYTISAVADQVPGETDTTDNTLTNGWVFITIPGDINADLKVNILDCIIIANHFGHANGNGHTPDTKEWKDCLNSDINNDNRVNILDCIILAGHFGEKDP